MFSHTFRRSLLAAAMTTACAVGTAQAAPMLQFEEQWTFWSSGTAGTELEAGAEIVAVDLASNRAFVTNAEQREIGGDDVDFSRVDVVDLTTGNKIGQFNLTNSGAAPTMAGDNWGSVNSVAVKNGVVAVAVENGASKQANGEVWLFDANHDFTSDPTPTANSRLGVGALPDMVTFTPDGSKILVANEGEPNGDYDNDPNGSVSVIDVAGGTVTNIGFTDFNAGGTRAAELPADVRIFGPGASVAQDLEPEYITVSPDGATAFVTLQENNAIARIDLATNTITEIQSLGFKDHSLPGNEFDASDRDGIDGNLQNWPTLGMYQPDAIDSYVVNGNLYYVTANEGDARDYDGYSEEARVKDLGLDPVAFPDAATLQEDENLGRLKTTTANGGDGNGNDHEEIYSYGGRSFSIRDADGNIVYDSGSLIEAIIAGQYPDLWQEGRSDDKGPEPESIKIVEINDWFYALVGLERTSGFMVFDITDPNDVMFQDYVFNEDDVAPEGIDWALVSSFDRGGMGYVAVSNEVSGTTTLYRASAVPVPASIALLGLGLVGLRLRKR